jgi:hypothetical protein
MCEVYHVKGKTTKPHAYLLFSRGIPRVNAHILYYTRNSAGVMIFNCIVQFSHKDPENVGPIKTASKYSLISNTPNTEYGQRKAIRVLCKI